MSIACLQSEIDIKKLCRYFRKSRINKIHFHLRGNGCLFMWGAYFCMGAYKCDVVVVIKMGAYSWVLILCGCLLSRFYGIYFLLLNSFLFLSCNLGFYGGLTSFFFSSSKSTAIGCIQHSFLHLTLPRTYVAKASRTVFYMLHRNICTLIPRIDDADPSFRASR